MMTIINETWKAENQTIITGISRMLKAAFGDIIQDVVLFGSRARGDAGDGSDYDVLVLVNGAYDWRLENAIIDKCYEADLLYDIVTDIKIFPVKQAVPGSVSSFFATQALIEGVHA